MRSQRRARWVPSAGMLGVAVMEVAIFTGRGEPVVGALVGAVFAGLAWWQSPLRVGPTTPHDVARDRHAREGAVVIYWRPGCRYCARLRRQLGAARARAVWVNVWADDDAVAFLREVQGGSETVPTVLLGDAVRTNPPVSEVRRALAV